MDERQELRKLIVRHFRRATCGTTETDCVEFSVILEKHGKRFRFGQHYSDGTGHKPKDIFELLREGWEFVLVESCFKWEWTSHRYTGEPSYGARAMHYQDRNGRYYHNDLWCGWYDKSDVAIGVISGRTRFEEKVYRNVDTDKETTKFGIPDEVKKLIEETEWGHSVSDSRDTT